MKKVFLAISMLAVAFGFTACSNEDEAVNSAKKGKATVVAFTENETRTALSGSDTEGYQVVWSKGDKITIGTETFDIDEKSIAGTTAKFTGNTLAEDTYTALYGINEMVWPSKQTYKEGNVANFPMYASATVDAEGNISPLSFKNLGGLLRLTVMGESTRKIKSIEVASDNPMAGAFEIRNDAARITTKATINPIKSIVLDCGSNGVPLSADGTDFYIALPIQRVGNVYTGVKIYLTSTDGNVCVKTFKGENGLTITRSQITKASFTVKETEFVTGITANSSVGTVGLLNCVEGMVVELNDKKVVIATKNVDATTIDGGAGSTDPEAASCYGVFNLFAFPNYGGNVNFGGNGWRLPTKAELEALKGEISWSNDRHGAIWQVADGSTLFLPAAGRFISTSVKFEDVGVKGYYVCQRENFDINNKEIYGLWFDANDIKVSNIGSASYVVRAFHDMPTE